MVRLVNYVAVDEASLFDQIRMKVVWCRQSYGRSETEEFARVEKLTSVVHETVVRFERFRKRLALTEVNAVHV